MRRGSWLGVAAVGALAGALVAAVLVPPEATMGDLARVLFVHVPAAWLAYLAFGVTLIAGTSYLATRSLRWDRLAGASAEIGVFFTALTIALGMIWGKSTWGVWWTWDARLVLTAVMLFVYLGYLALRRSILDAETRARRAAWLGIIAAFQIPIVHFSVQWWRTLHQPPTILRPGEMQIDPPFFTALLVSLAAFTLLYITLVRQRIDLSRVDAAVDAALTADTREVAGDDIDPPRLRTEEQAS